MNHFKSAVYSIVFIFIAFLFYVSYKAQRDIFIEKEKLSENNTNPVVFIPTQENNLNYEGVIRESDDPNFKYTLEKDGKVVLYLKSSKQDLSLMTGLGVVLVGDIQGNYKDIAIMDVKSIKLK
jgi:hypothetical protein